MGCEWAGMRVSEQLVAQRLWHHELDGITIPSDQYLVLKEDGGPHGPKFSSVQRQGAQIVQSRTVAL